MHLLRIPGGLFRSVSVVLALVLLAACGGDDSTTIAGTIVAGKEINPGYQNEPRPVVVRVIELKQASKFNGASFFDLFDKAQQTLGGDFIKQTEYEVVPGGTITIPETTLDDNTKLLGIIAAFRAIDTSKWRTTLSPSLTDDNTIEIDVKGDVITAKVTDS